MARKIVLKENGLAGSDNAPSGYKYLGDSGGDISEKVGATVSALGGGSEYTETIVNISSAQILAMGDTPIELLPLSGSSKYYDIPYIIIEYVRVSSHYTLTEVLKVTGGAVLLIDPALITSGASNQAIIVYNSPYLTTSIAGAFSITSKLSFNLGLYLTTSDSENPTVGSGTLRVKIYHKTITFGA